MNQYRNIQMTDSRTYSYTRDGKCFEGGFSSPDEAAQAAFDDDPSLQYVYVGRNITFRASEFVNGYEIIEGAMDAANSEDWLFNTLRDSTKLKELEAIIGDWMEQQEPIAFFKVEDIQKISRGE